MKISLTSIMVSDQDRALRFYTEVLGFVKKYEFPAGPYRWISVVSPEAPDSTQLSLEPNANPAGKAFQEAMFSQGIPVAVFQVDNIAAEYARMTKLGVRFTVPPSPAGPVTRAVLDDTCGNLIQIIEV
jgi:catechol 2,3-dioxygenase-like lactoylglutathione lyase family enzyme